MRIRATRRVQGGSATVEWECDIECTIVEFIQPQVEVVIDRVLFRDVDTSSLSNAGETTRAQFEEFKETCLDRTGGH